MKIENTGKHKNKLLKLQLIKSKIYKKKFAHSIKVEEIEYMLKKTLNVINKYHQNDKRILFVGNPFKLTKKFKNFFKTTKHIFVPECVWVEGILTNQQACFRYLSKNQKLLNNKTSKILVKLKSKIDLIIIAENNLKSKIVEEGYKTKIPVIFLKNSILCSDFKSSYAVPGNFQFTNKKIRQHLFYSLIFSVLKNKSRLSAV